MKQAFTLWPGKALANSASGLEPLSHPAWARQSAAATKGELSTIQSGTISATLAVPVLSIFVLPIALRGWHLAVAAMLLLVASAITAIVVYRTLRRSHMVEAQLQGKIAVNDALFERAGISLWLEDWTAARDEVITLLKAGITDVRAYYTERPDELRALRQKVLIKDVNHFTLQMMGDLDKSVFVGPLSNILPDTDQTFSEWLVCFARGDSYYRSEAHIVRPDGKEINALFTAGIPHDMNGFKNIIVSALDITDYKAAQGRLSSAERDIIRASRATTMGALSASIAHEVNSPLAAIVSHAEAGLRWLDRHTPDLDEAQLALQSVITDAARARDVVERTQGYLNNAPVQAEPIDLPATVRNAILLIERELRDLKISLSFDADEGLPEVFGDAIQIQQVAVNLMLNGAQAMVQIAEPRDLTVTVRRDAEMLVVKVRDEGPGIEGEKAQEIFEPFYSTKEGGMGMGLAICRTVVNAHGGRIWVTSENGGGAAFHFTIPISKE